MYCGEWVLNSYKTTEDSIYRETDKFEQYIFGYTKDFKLEKFIEREGEDRKYFPTAQMEEAFHKYIDKYNERQKHLW
jgi:hypothetical protein